MHEGPVLDTVVNRAFAVRRCPLDWALAGWIQGPKGFFSMKPRVLFHEPVQHVALSAIGQWTARTASSVPGDRRTVSHVEEQTWITAAVGLVGVAVGGGFQLLANRQAIAAADRRAAAASAEHRHELLRAERDTGYAALVEQVHAANILVEGRLLDNAADGPRDGPDLEDVELLRAQQGWTSGIAAAIRSARPRATRDVIAEAERAVSYIHEAVASAGSGGTHVPGWTYGRTPVDVLDRLVAFELRLWREDPRLDEHVITARTAAERQRLHAAADDPESADFT
jgi:hypothetical protein